MDGAWNDKLNLQPFSHVEPVISRMIGSWMTGVNRNVEGKQAPRIMRYRGGHPAYREHCDAVAAEGYRRLSWNRLPLQSLDRYVARHEWWPVSDSRMAGRCAR